ncbi:DUF3047 domain-containing protein [Pigmentiphaga soli]|uniref:DUF3047 domain-containing protein n=1 Tax=Pigmentiphaga soli TaxID=1007095 RepID=A0ABP8HQB7_9BURK
MSSQSGATAPGPAILAATLAPLALSATASAPGEPPAGWQPWVIRPDKKKTRYAVAVQAVDGQERRVLHAAADSAASGLWVPVDVPAAAATRISWSWRAGALIEGADGSRPEAEDAPVRLVLAFDGDWRRLPLRDQMQAETARFLTGRDMPYATLIYTWDACQPVEAMIPNAYSARIKKKVVESGPSNVGRWRRYERDFAQDFIEAFGEPPGRLIGIGVLTDTDNTRTSVQGWYGDIQLLTAGRRPFGTFAERAALD